MRFLFATACMMLIFTLRSQNTVGLQSLDSKQAFDGYTFVYPVVVSNHYLINNCGEKMHEWTDSIQYVGGASYLNKDGNLYKTKRLRDNSKDPIFAPGAASTIEIRDWSNKILWSYTLNNDSIRLHHDLDILPNNNILITAWELKSKAACIQAGRDTMTIPPTGLLNELIWEIDPKTNNVVWAWSAWDHLIQDFDPTKSNYGVLKDNPQKININSNKSGTAGLPLADWMHINSIDFNPEINQIMISVPTFGEFYIIDHSTTTAQAKTSNGGLAKKGGDLLYRWGNESNYIKDAPKPQQLFFQHDARWILNLPANHPDFGKVSVFNNRFAADQSLPSILVTPWDMYTWTYLDNNKKYGPSSIEKSIVTNNKAKQQSPITSSIQILPNNNTLLTAGAKGYLYEINAKKDVVWEYTLPYKLTLPVDQGTVLALQDNTIFNAYKYPKNYSAFINKNLTPIGFIETNPNKDFCNKLTPINENEISDIIIYPNPLSKSMNIIVESTQDMIIYNSMGAVVMKDELMKGHNIIDINLAAGFYNVVLPSSNISKHIIVE
jgi:hypothetical protein